MSKIAFEFHVQVHTRKLDTSSRSNISHPMIRQNPTDNPCRSTFIHKKSQAVQDVQCNPFSSKPKRPFPAQQIFHMVLYTLFILHRPPHHPGDRPPLAQRAAFARRLAGAAFLTGLASYFQAQSSLVVTSSPFSFFPPTQPLHTVAFCSAHFSGNSFFTMQSS